jgi:hypothetical protein
MIQRSSIITGLINMAFKDITDVQFEGSYKVLNRMTNDEISNVYYKYTGVFIRQIFHDTFVVLN